MGYCDYHRSRACLYDSDGQVISRENVVEYEGSRIRVCFPGLKEILAKRRMELETEELGYAGILPVPRSVNEKAFRAHW